MFCLFYTNISSITHSDRRTAANSACHRLGPDDRKMVNVERRAGMSQSVYTELLNNPDSQKSTFNLSQLEGDENIQKERFLRAVNSEQAVSDVWAVLKHHSLNQ